ncbi:hypothetical protein RB653_006194 [Dictyostelium firmibasis]|uniref:Uncharacterized protein n=1 Tax=Dictyostelium firmibasis TaxID=79012 RepID=A0AAN7YYV1_9MYCE
MNQLQKNLKLYESQIAKKRQDIKNDYIGISGESEGEDKSGCDGSQSDCSSDQDYEYKKYPTRKNGVNNTKSNSINLNKY